MNPAAPSALSPPRTAKKETEVAPPLAARSPEWAESVCSMEEWRERERYSGRGGWRDGSERRDGRTEASERASAFVRSFESQRVSCSRPPIRSTGIFPSHPAAPALPSVFLSLTRVEPRCVPQSSNVSPSSAAVLPPRARSLAPNRWITCCFLKSCIFLA